MKKKIVYPKWSREALDWLGRPNAPRALGLADIQAAAEAATGSPVGKRAARSAAAAWEADGSLRHVGGTLWLNGVCRPRGRLEDALVAKRPGAVSSLHSVLGSCGAHNNPSVMAFAVEPSDGPAAPAKVVSTALGDMRLLGLPPAFFEAPPGERWTSETTSFPSFVPEKALLDWIYLGGQAAARQPGPNPGDVDLHMIDLDKAGAWAGRLGLSVELAHWLRRHPEPTEQSRSIVERELQGSASGTEEPKERRSEGPLREKARARGLSS